MIYFIFFFSLFLIYKILVALPIKFPKFKLQPSRLDIVYGGPGSGKTSFACYTARRAILSGVPVYSNVPIKGCFALSKFDIGRFAMNDCLVIIDEAGIEYNNRDFRTNFSGGKGIGQIYPPTPAGAAGAQKNDPNKTQKIDQNKALEWWKKHRHEGAQILVLSQGFDDMDKKIQTLGSHYWIVRHSFIPGMISIRQIRKKPVIDENTHQPIDYYDFLPFSKKRFFMRPLWKYFDSFDKMNLPSKSWDVYK